MPKSVRKFFALFSLSLSTLFLAGPGYATITTVDLRGPGHQSRESETAVKRLKTAAELFAAADSASTYLALQNPLLHERNPMVNTSAGGLVALAATKILMLELFDLKLSTSEKKTLYPIASALSASVSANNLLLAVSAANPVAIAGGIAVGLYTHQTQTAYAQHDNLTLYCSGGSHLRNCNKDYSPQYVVRLR
jgi:hypothetical protein